MILPSPYELSTFLSLYVQTKKEPLICICLAEQDRINFYIGLLVRLLLCTYQIYSIEGKCFKIAIIILWQIFMDLQGTLSIYQFIFMRLLFATTNRFAVAIFLPFEACV